METKFEEYISKLQKISPRAILFYRRFWDKKTKSLSSTKWRELKGLKQKPDDRVILLNEVVFELDDESWEVVAKTGKRIVKVLQELGIPFFVAFSGNKSLHIHAFLDVSSEEINNDYRFIRLNLWNYVLDKAGIPQEQRGEGHLVDDAVVRWDDETKGHGIRLISGRKFDKRTGRFLSVKYLLDSIPKEKPKPRVKTDEFPEEILIWKPPKELLRVDQQKLESYPKISVDCPALARILEDNNAKNRQRTYLALAIKNGLKLPEEEAIGYLIKNARWGNFNESITRDKIKRIYSNEKLNKRPKKENLECENCNKTPCLVYSDRKKHATRDRLELLEELGSAENSIVSPGGTLALDADLLAKIGRVGRVGSISLERDRYEDPPGYKELRASIPLGGGDYNLPIKASWYKITSNAVKNRERLIKFGRRVMDSRIPLGLIAIPSKGKNEIYYRITESLKAIGQTHVLLPGGGFNPEQLIGKVVIRSKKGGEQGEKDYIQNPGHFIESEVGINECLDLLNSTLPDKITSRAYLRIAMDTVGRNGIPKRAVDILKSDLQNEDSFWIYPECGITLLFQPAQLESHLLTEGLLRRVLLVYFVIKPEESLQGALDSMDGNLEEEQIHRVNWEGFLQNLNAQEFNFSITGEAKDAIKFFTRALCLQGFKRGGSLVYYTDIMIQDLMNFLIKMSCCRAAANNRSEVQMGDVTNAYIDLSAFWDSSLDFVSRYVPDLGALDIPEEQLTIMEYLYEEKAISKDETELTASKFDKDVSGILECSERWAREYRKQMRERGLLNTGYIRGKMRVWLTKMGLDLIALLAFQAFQTLPKEGKKESQNGTT